jgi:hypothetical protein
MAEELTFLAANTERQGCAVKVRQRWMVSYVDAVAVGPGVFVGGGCPRIGPAR